MEDFLKGPEWLERVDNDLLIASLKTEQNHLLHQAGQKTSIPLFLRAIICCLMIAFTMRKLRLQWRRLASDLTSAERWKERFLT